MIGGFLRSSGGSGVDTDLPDAGRDLAFFDSSGVAGGVSFFRFFKKKLFTMYFQHSSK
jgi:hypothetical protein